MVKCLCVYLHQAASLPDCQLCAVLWVLLKLSGGDCTMSHPGSVKRGDHIESTCCWRHMGRIRHRVDKIVLGGTRAFCLNSVFPNPILICVTYSPAPA
uniref:Uncharacterized protein n=1 Tax=Neolamprologus brichardi TaxID=32507 RepID=A0A3Q4NAE9_NEOBR